MCTSCEPQTDQPTASANWRTVTMRMPACPSITSKSLSPVTTHPQSAATASARTSSSSRSRQTAAMRFGRGTNRVASRATRVSRAACRGVAPNLSGSFSSISSKIHSPEYTSCSTRRRRQNRRHTPWRVSTASQTLVSSRTFTPESQSGQRENFILGHGAVNRQRICPREKCVVVLHDPVDDLRLFVFGHPFQFFDHLGCGHARKLAPGVASSSLQFP